jgi:hypothetical protein
MELARALASMRSGLTASVRRWGVVTLQPAITLVTGTRTSVQTLTESVSTTGSPSSAAAIRGRHPAKRVSGVPEYPSVGAQAGAAQAGGKLRLAREVVQLLASICPRSDQPLL